MVLPYRIFSCDKCEFESSTLRYFGSYYLYKDPRRYFFFPISKTLGFCQDCKDIEEIEVIPKLKVFERAKEIHSALQDDSLEFPYEENHEVLNIAVEKNLYILENIIKSKRPPVCLTCGGVNVSNITLPKTHPGCGGNLEVRSAETSTKFGINFDAYDLFDTQGKLIEKRATVNYIRPDKPHIDGPYLERTKQRILQSRLDLDKEK